MGVPTAIDALSCPSAEATPFTPPQISLPKGGGAIRGIDEKFAANPVTFPKIAYWLSINGSPRSSETNATSGSANVKETPFSTLEYQAVAKAVRW